MRLIWTDGIGEGGFFSLRTADNYFAIIPVTNQRDKEYVRNTIEKTPLYALETLVASFRGVISI